MLALEIPTTFFVGALFSALAVLVIFAWIVTYLSNERMKQQMAFLEALNRVREEIRGKESEFQAMQARIVVIEDESLIDAIHWEDGKCKPEALRRARAYLHNSIFSSIMGKIRYRVYPPGHDSSVGPDQGVVRGTLILIRHDQNDDGPDV